MELAWKHWDNDERGDSRGGRGGEEKIPFIFIRLRQK